MPIYEFYCDRCNTIFNFYSPVVNTEKRPNCPHCKENTLERMLSRFSTPRKSKGKEEEDLPLGDIDEDKLERAMSVLAQEAENIDEENPKEAVRLVRKLTSMTGLELGPAMEEALNRMEAGQDPEQIEEEMGDLLENEEPFVVQKSSGARRHKRPPKTDEKLYFL